MEQTAYFLIFGWFFLNYRAIKLNGRADFDILSRMTVVSG